MEQKKIIPKICTCGELMGHRQKDYEDRILEELEKNKDLRKIELDLHKEFGWVKICCRKTYLNSRIPFIRDSNKDAYVDNIDLFKTKTKLPITKNCCEIFPTKKVPDFPKLIDDEIIEEIKNNDEEIIETELLPSVIPIKQTFKLVRKK
jgi:DNA-directed RNA polymerase subunit N (RpoN/RPB10)